jgi:predicted membrane protein
VTAVVVGVAAVVVGNWWTAAGMALVLVGQVLAERAARRTARRETPPGAG